MSLQSIYNKSTHSYKSSNCRHTRQHFSPSPDWKSTEETRPIWKIKVRPKCSMGEVKDLRLLWNNLMGVWGVQPINEWLPCHQDEFRWHLRLNAWKQPAACNAAPFSSRWLKISCQLHEKLFFLQSVKVNATHRMLSTNKQQQTRHILSSSETARTETFQVEQNHRDWLDNWNKHTIHTISSLAKYDTRCDLAVRWQCRRCQRTLKVG